MSTNETVRAWATTNAGNAAADGQIASSDSQSADTVDNNIRSIMAAVKKQMNDIGGSLAAGGTANALTVTTGQVLESGQITDGLRILLKATADNTSTTVTFAPDTLTAANIKRADGSALAVGSIKSGMYLDLIYNSGSSEWRCSNIPPVSTLTASGGSTGFLFGLTLSNDSGGTTAIAVAAGSARDSTDVDMLALSSALTGKVLANAWTVGNAGGLLDTGAVANTTYHIYLIKRPDTGVVDAIASTSASAPTLPANYTLYRRIGSILRTAGAIVLFKQDGDRFRRLVGVRDVLSTNPGTSAVTATLSSLPTGIVWWADIIFGIANGSTNISAIVTALDETDTNPTGSVWNYNSGPINTSILVPFLMKTNTSSQIRYRLSGSGASDTVEIWSYGWIDQRGRIY
jgi:hypothetical protein